MVQEVQILMLEHEFHKIQVDHYMFVKRYDEGDFLILLLYVDDMLIVGQDTRRILTLKRALGKSFAMKDLGPTKHILGMHIVRDRTKKVFWLSQEKYVSKILERFNMLEANSVGSVLPKNYKLNAKQCPKSEKDKAEMSKVLYASIVGSLIYVMVCTRSDLTFVVGAVSRCISNPRQEHWATIKRILMYLKGTSSVCLMFGVGKSVLEGFTNSDMSRDVDSSGSTSGYVYAGGAVSWQSRLWGLVNHRGKVYGSGKGRQRTYLDEEFPR